MPTQVQALLRVHACRFAWRNAEEGGIKLIHVLDEAAPFRDDLSLPTWFIVVKLELIPTTRGNFFNGVDFVTEQTPEVIWALHAPWQTTPNTDDGNWFAGK